MLFSYSSIRRRFREGQNDPLHEKQPVDVHVASNAVLPGMLGGPVPCAHPPIALGACDRMVIRLLGSICFWSFPCQVGKAGVGVWAWRPDVLDV